MDDRGIVLYVLHRKINGGQCSLSFLENSIREDTCDGPQSGVVLVGFGSYQDTVIAGRSWDAPIEVMEVPPARPGSWEQALCDLDAEDRLLLFQPPAAAGAQLAAPRGH